MNYLHRMNYPFPTSNNLFHNTPIILHSFKEWDEILINGVRWNSLAYRADQEKMTHMNARGPEEWCYKRDIPLTIMFNYEAMSHELELWIGTIIDVTLANKK